MQLSPVHIRQHMHWTNDSRGRGDLSSPECSIAMSNLPGLNPNYRSKVYSHIFSRSITSSRLLQAGVEFPELNIGRPRTIFSLSLATTLSTYDLGCCDQSGGSNASTGIRFPARARGHSFARE